MNKEKLLMYAIVAIVAWLLYKIITFFIYRKLTKKLKDADLDAFTQHFGDDYVFRFSSNDVRRYKWKKGLFVVKASFDKQDRLTGRNILPFDFFTLFTKLVFY